MKEDNIKLWGIAEENTKYLFIQYPVGDIYRNHRYIDFALESEGKKIAIEIDGGIYYDPSKISFSRELPMFMENEEFLPEQKRRIFILKDHQKEALDNLQDMREKGENIALLYHATDTGKTVIDVLDAKKVDKKTLF